MQPYIEIIVEIIAELEQEDSRISRSFRNDFPTAVASTACPELGPKFWGRQLHEMRTDICLAGRGRQICTLWRRAGVGDWCVRWRFMETYLSPLTVVALYTRQPLVGVVRLAVDKYLRFL